jgi:hypothetical protein
MRKLIKWIVVGVVVLVIAAVGIVWLNLNRIVRSTVQSQSASSLGVDTSLASANVSLLSGNLGLKNFEVGSPKGFSAKRMFVLGGIKVDTSFGQLTKTPIHIGSIEISKPYLVIEQSGGKLNVKALMDQIPSTPEQPSSGGGAKEPIRVIIDHLKLTGASIDIRPGIPGVVKQIKIEVPGVELENIGSGDGAQNGAAIKDVVMKVIAALTQKAAESDKLPPEVRQLLSLDLGKITSQIGSQVQKTIQNVTTNPAAIGNAGKDLEQGLKGLIPQKPKDSKKGDQ